MLTGSGQVLLLAGAVDGELAFGLGRGDQIVHTVKIAGILALRLGFRRRGGGLPGSGCRGSGRGSFCLAAAGSKGQNHDQSQKQRKILLHIHFPPFVKIPGPPG